MAKTCQKPKSPNRWPNCRSRRRRPTKWVKPNVSRRKRPSSRPSTTPWPRRLIAEAERIEAERRAALEAPAKAEKAKIEVEAEAEAAKRRIEAEGEASAILCQTRSEGPRTVRNARQEG